MIMYWILSRNVANVRVAITIRLAGIGTGDLYMPTVFYGYLLLHRECTYFTTRIGEKQY